MLWLLELGILECVNLGGCGLEAEAGGVLGDRELTEHGQAAPAGVVAGLGAAEGAGGAAAILVLVGQGGVGQGAGAQRPWKHPGGSGA